MPSTERASPVTLGEFLCAALLLAGVVATMWLLAKPWEDSEEPCLRGSVGLTYCRVHAGEKLAGASRNVRAMGRPRYFCVQPTSEGPCGEKAVGWGKCREHGGNPNARCLHPTPDGPCQKQVQGGGEVQACIAHGGGKRCHHPTPAGPCQKLVQNGGEVKACIEHGGGKKRQRCLHPTPNGPCQTWVARGSKVQACMKHGGRKPRRCLHPTPSGPCPKNAIGGGSVQKCVAHGGGVRCGSEACAVLGPPPFAKFRTAEGQPRCWSCLAAQYPERAKLKVRKEHLLLAELQRRLPWLGEWATQLVWDCPVPGGCTLKRPDMLYRLNDRFVQVEVDEEGHEDLSCADEDSRLELIAADVGLPGLVLRLNPDAERTLKRVCFRNGESAFAVGQPDAFNALFDSAEAEVEAFLNEPAPEGVRVAGFPASWWEGR